MVGISYLSLADDLTDVVANVLLACHCEFLLRDWEKKLCCEGEEEKRRRGEFECDGEEVMRFSHYIELENVGVGW